MSGQAGSAPTNALHQTNYQRSNVVSTQGRLNADAMSCRPTGENNDIEKSTDVDEFGLFRTHSSLTKQAMFQPECGGTCEGTRPNHPAPREERRHNDESQDAHALRFGRHRAWLWNGPMPTNSMPARNTTLTQKQIILRATKYAPKRRTEFAAKPAS